MLAPFVRCANVANVILCQKLIYGKKCSEGRDLVRCGSCEKKRRKMMRESDDLEGCLKSRWLLLFMVVA